MSRQYRGNTNTSSSSRDYSRDGGRRSFSSHFERDSLFDDRDDYYQPRDRPDYDKFGDEFDKDILVKEDHKTYSEKAPPSEDEIFKVVHDGIDFKKHSNITIDCSDKSIVPITQFTDASGLHPKVLKNISRAKYTDPTPVQRYAIPIGLAGRDLMACAQTGSGKTAAFLVPGLTRLLELKPPERNRRYSEPYALILAPTRELAVQIQKEVLKFSYETWIRSSVLYGGAPIGGQARDLERGVDVVVGTPGRVKDFIKRGKLFFNETRFLCLDEADRMLDMGFEKDIRAIIKGVNPSRHTVMFSATFPREIRELATDFLRNHVFLSVGRVGAAVDTITQVIKEVSELDKRTEILKDAKAHPGRTLIFAEKKVDADRLARHLFANGVACTAIHGSRTQNEREAALAAFKAGRLHILVATDVASRGLDVPDIVHVINYDLPATIDSYIHRVGRTGRAGNKGLATSYYNHEQNAALAKDLVKTLKEAKQEIPEYLLDGCAWGKKKRGFGGRGRSGGGGRRMGGGGGGGGGARPSDPRRKFMQRNEPYHSSSSYGAW